MLPVDYLLIVNSIRDRNILLIVFDIFLRKEAENHHSGRYSNAKTAVYPFKVIQGYGFWYQSKARVHIPISDHLSIITLVISCNRFRDMAA